jgi:hypothetical protein
MTDHQPPASKLPCICCGYLTITTGGYYEICPVCHWEDTDHDYSDPDEYVGGPNHVTLSQGRRNFKEFGAAERRDIDRCRPPRPEEIPRP